jgi:hypothetical protein
MLFSLLSQHFDKLQSWYYCRECFYVVRRSDGLRWHDVATKFRYDRFRILCNIKVTTTQISAAATLVLGGI